MSNNITGERIKALREEKGLSKEDLGKMIGKDRTSIYRYENGIVSKIHYAILVQIANSLGTTVRYLNGETDDPKQYPKDILETTGAYNFMHNLFQDNSNISTDDLYECTDKEKQFIQKIIRNTHLLSDDDYDALNKVFDSLLNTRQVIDNTVRHD